MIHFERVPRLKAATFNRKLNSTVPANEMQALITLQFVYLGEEKTQVVEMIRRTMRRNASFWEFKCPDTGRLCRQLYLIRGRYAHRDAFRKQALYRAQHLSKKQRQLDAKLKQSNGADDAIFRL